MAKDIKYIENGITVDIGWTQHIAISGDNVNWSAINKTGLSASLHYVNLNTLAPNSFPERNKETGPVIVVKHSDSEGAILKFNPENVIGQAGWVGNPQQALDDILTWIATV